MKKQKMNQKNNSIWKYFSLKKFLFSVVGALLLHYSFSTEWDIQSSYTINDFFTNDFLVNFITWVNPQFNEINYYFFVILLIHYFLLTYKRYFKSSIIARLHMFIIFYFTLTGYFINSTELLIMFNDISANLSYFMNIDLSNISLFYIFLLKILFQFTLWVSLFLRTLLLHAIFLNRRSKTIIFMFWIYIFYGNILVYFFCLSFLRGFFCIVVDDSLYDLIVFCNDIFLLYNKKIKFMKRNYQEI